MTGATRGANDVSDAQSAPSSRRITAKFSFRSETAALAGVLVLGLAIRIISVLSNAQVQYFTEVFQYYEQAHRLAFGSGVVPFEYDFGIRSWLVPGLVAAVMRVCRWFSANPLVYVDTVRCIAALLSLVPIYCGFTMVLPRAGLMWATITGVFCAVWHHAIFMSSSILPEILSAYLMFPAILIAGDETRNDRRAVPLGAILGLAFCLRLQMAPALFVIACWYCRGDWRSKWLPLSLGGIAVVCVVAGLLDWATLGTPFQSIWLNYYLNAVLGIDKSFGHLPLSLTYVSYIAPTGAIPILVLLWLAVIGAFRAPLLAATALAVLVTHALVEHREYRFIVFVLLALPILIGFGAKTLADIIERRAGRPAALAASAAALVLVPVTSSAEWAAGRPPHLSGNTGIVRAFSAAHDQTDLCGLGVADYHWAATGGYTYLDRNVPIYYSYLLIPSKQPLYYEQTNFVRGPRRSSVPLRMHVVLGGKTIVQFPGETLLKNTAAFNYLIVAKDRRATPAGYRTMACFPNELGSPWPPACLMHRAGGCREP